MKENLDRLRHCCVKEFENEIRDETHEKIEADTKRDFYEKKIRERIGKVERDFGREKRKKKNYRRKIEQCERKMRPVLPPPKILKR